MMKRVISNSIVLAISLIISFFVCEFLLRTVIFSDYFKNKINIHYFANYYESDNAYRLLLRNQLKGREEEPIFPEFDPQVGWTAETVTKDNPLGIVTDKGYTIDEYKDKRTLLFFGDSFIEGLTDINYKIPQLLDKKLDGISVLNFGVAGYGFDQMYLRLHSVINLFDKPHIVIGLIYPDIDRCVFKVMHSAKPYFEVENDSLVLKGVPIPANYGKWLRLYPITIKSYLFAGFKGIIRRILVSRFVKEHWFEFYPSESPKRKNEKKTICRLLIKKIKNECDAKGSKLTFILFPDRIDMIHKGWYEIFLKKTFTDLDVNYLDLTEPLKKYLDSNNLKWYSDLYRLRNHPDARENEVISGIIKNYLLNNYYISTSIDSKRLSVSVH